ncbi:MAG: Crp/Fnr family transcriptional regulator [Bacteroidales bacterium]|nr:Crp/Fnr family transcriptional regulator [Bacteroidales bacterium]
MDLNQTCKNCKFRSHLFDKLSDEQLDSIYKNKKSTFIEKGSIIVNAGDPIREFIYLTDGLVKLQKIGIKGKEQIITIARPMDFISLLSVLSKDTYEYTITTLVDSQVCRIDLNVMRNMLRENSDFSLDILRYISNTADDIIKHTYLLNSKNLRGRIAMLLVEFAEKYFHSSEYILPMSRKEIAEMIDMTPENVIRIMSEFKKDGVIKLRSKQVEIINMELLKKIRDLG